MELPTFTRICNINWNHGKLTPRNQIGDGLIIVFDQAVTAADLHDQSIRVFRDQREANDPADHCWCQVRGEIVPGDASCDFKKPFKKSGLASVSAARFLFELRAGLYRVVVIGDFIRDAKTDLAVDANHLPPWLPQRKTGDGIEGGIFESWFELV